MRKLRMDTTKVVFWAIPLGRVDVLPMDTAFCKWAFLNLMTREKSTLSLPGSPGCPAVNYGGMCVAHRAHGSSPVVTWSFFQLSCHFPPLAPSQAWG